MVTILEYKIYNIWDPEEGLVEDEGSIPRYQAGEYKGDCCPYKSADKKEVYYSCLKELFKPGENSLFCGIGVGGPIPGKNCRTKISDILRKCCLQRGKKLKEAPKEALKRLVEDVRKVRKHDREHRAPEQPETPAPSAPGA